MSRVIFLVILAPPSAARGPLYSYLLNHCNLCQSTVPCFQLWRSRRLRTLHMPALCTPFVCIHTSHTRRARARPASLEILLHPSGGFTPQCGGSGRLPFPFVVLCHHDLALSIPIFGLIFNTPWCVHLLLGRVVCVCAQFGIALHCISHRLCFTHSLCVRACVW